MAAVMEVVQLRALLGRAAREGATLAWIDEGELLTGPDVGRANTRVDFALERLVTVEPAREAVRVSPRRQAGASALAPTAQGAASLQPVDETLVRRPGRRTGHFAVVLEGRVVAAPSQRALLLSALREIERARPGMLDKLSAEKGRTKRPVARRRELLYDDPKLAKHADRIEGGWWVATNNSFGEVEKFIRRAAFHAGLDVDIRRLP